MINSTLVTGSTGFPQTLTSTGTIKFSLINWHQQWLTLFISKHVLLQSFILAAAGAYS